MRKELLKVKRYKELLKYIDGAKKIAIVGAGGSGKSSLAQSLAIDLKYELFSLDMLFWKKNWVCSSPVEFSIKQRSLFVKDYIIIEGTYENFLDERLEACDLFILVSVNPFICLFRVLIRTLNSKGRVRNGMPEGCIEKISLEYFKFLFWILTYSKVEKYILKKCKEHGKKLLLFTSSNIE
jgi:adenylate kinase family enzyme